MKLRLLPTLVGLAIGFAATALAEEQSTVNPEVRQQIEAELAKFDDAFNNNDAAGIVSQFTPDAIEVWDGTRVLEQLSDGMPSSDGIHSVRQSLRNFQTSLFRYIQSATAYARSLNSMTRILKERTT